MSHNVSFIVVLNIVPDADEIKKKKDSVLNTTQTALEITRDNRRAY